jgi:predicted  nucleic acid-binding Zn-ribbon protein
MEKTMSKTYTLLDSIGDDEKKTIAINEVKEVSSKHTTSIAKLKEHIARKKHKISLLEEQINSIIDDIQAIKDSVGIEVEVPKKETNQVKLG